MASLGVELDEEGGAFPDGLVHVSDASPGIARRKAGKSFTYRDAQGRKVDRASTLIRIRALGIPPAWREVWICARPNGHIQATGLDAAGRKQYRYHAEWQAFRSERKFDRLAAFGRALPKIRRKVAATLKRGGLDRDHAVAALVRLLDKGALRIGSNEKSPTGAVGATSLRSRQVRMGKQGIQLDYIAKGGKRVRRQLSDRTLQRTLEAIGDLPGARLFQYVGDDDAVHPLDSADVNRWLKDAAGDDGVSAKTFRTWAGTLAAFEAAMVPGAVSVKTLCEAAAGTLYNTPTICRGSYVHPAVIDLAGPDDAARMMLLKRKVKAIAGLKTDEARLVAFLERPPGKT